MPPFSFGHPLLHLAALMHNERLSPDELAHRQSVKLRRLVDHAYRQVPFYRRRMEHLGVNPNDIRAVEDLPKLPIVDKSDFHRAPDSDRRDRRRADTARLKPISTSGSSGATLWFHIDRPYDRLRKAQFLRPYVANGLTWRDRIVTFTGHPRPVPKLYMRAGILPEYQIHSNLDADLQLESMARFRPTVVRGYPSVLAALGARMLERGLNPPPLRLLFTDSELLSTDLRHTIESAFRQRAIDIYGTLETENIAYECPRHRGHHVAVDCVIMELLRDGRPVAAGTEGEIVCTVLDAYTTPFIRYNLHDLATLGGEACDCGRTFPLLTALHGRRHHYAHRSDGTRVSSTGLLAALDGLARHVRAYQVVQRERLRFHITVVPGAGFGAEVEAEMARIVARLFPGAHTRVEICDRVARLPSGKFEPFVSRVTENPTPDGKRHAD